MSQAWHDWKSGLAHPLLKMCVTVLLLTGQYKLLTTRLEYVVRAHSLHFCLVEQHVFESQNQTNLPFNTSVSFYLYKAFFFS